MMNIDFGAVDFGPIEIRPRGTGWQVAWEMRFNCGSAVEAGRLAGQLIAVTSAARGEYRVRVKIEREQELMDAAKAGAEGVKKSPKTRRPKL